jgi:Domain of unknown function (DUF4287)
MSFQAYIDNIKTKTGLLPRDFYNLAVTKGFIVDGQIPKKITATIITNWLKQEFQLGHGHAMAIFATLKNSNFTGTKNVDTKSK